MGTRFRFISFKLSVYDSLLFIFYCLYVDDDVHQLGGSKDKIFLC